MTVINSLGVNALSIRGAGTDYHRLSRVYESLAEANADSGFSATAGVEHVALIKGIGLAFYNHSSSQWEHTATELEANVDDLITLTGAAENSANLGTFSGSTIGDNLTVKAALQSLETSLEAIDLDTDDLAALTGIAENITNLGTFSGSTIADNQSVKAALQALETSLETMATSATVTEVDGNVNDLITLTGATENSTALGSFSGSTIADSSTITAALQALETSLELKSTIDDPTFTTKISSPAFHASGSNHLVLKAMTGNDLMVHLAGVETLQVTRSGTDCRFTSNGGSGTFKFNQETDLAGGMKLAGTAITATATELNYVDGVTSAIQTQLDAKATTTALNAVQADVDQNESDADTAIALKANIASPTFTGTPAAPTAAASTNTTQLATTAFVTTAIANLSDSAPGALDTLNELAAALGDDANFSTTVTNLINANETHIDNMATLTGAAKDSTNLSTFTGSTIADNQTIKAALQALETAVENRATSIELLAVQSDVDQNESDADAAIALKANIASPAFTGNSATFTGANDSPTTFAFIGGFPDLILRTNGTDVATNQNEGRVLFQDAGAGAVAAIKQTMLSTAPMRFFTGGITASDEQMRINANGRVGIGSTDPQALLHVEGSIIAKADFPDVALRSGGERRVLFADAGGSAEGGIKFSSNTFKIFAGGGIASGNEAIACNGTTIETKDDLVQNPGSSVTPAENGELVVEATNNTTLTFKLKGSDGTVRSGTITLS